MASKDDDKSTDRIKDSAQQIWLAGLGAFAKAQQEGSKVFEALVKDGVGMQKKTQAAAEEAQARMAGLAGEFGAKASGGWGKLENIFEERVARALEHLGIPTAAEVAALKARIEALEAQLQKAGKAAGAPRAAARTTRPTKSAARPAAEAVKAPKASRRRTPPRSDS